jgi:hypothetical protein
MPSSGESSAAQSASASHTSLRDGDDSSSLTETELELITELNERTTDDDDKVWQTYDSLKRAEGELPETDLKPIGGDVSALRAQVALLAAKQPPPPATRQLLTREQAAISAELIVVDHNQQRVRSASASHVASISSVHSNGKWVLQHPLWIQRGRKPAEAPAAVSAPSGSNSARVAAEAPVEAPPAQTVLLAPLNSIAPLALSNLTKSPSPGTRRASNSKAAPEPKKAAAVPVAAAPVEPSKPSPPPKSRSLGHGAAFVAARQAGAEPNASFDAFSVHLERVSVHSGNGNSSFGSLSDPLVETEVELRFGPHSILVSQRRNVVSGNLGRVYSFDGQRFREQFEEGVERGLGGWVDDTLRSDAAVWNACRSFVDANLLEPLALPTGRAGWILFFDEIIPFESCGQHLQLLRGLFDGELAGVPKSAAVAAPSASPRVPSSPSVQ